MKKFYKWTLEHDYEFYSGFDIGVARDYHDEQGRIWLTVDGSYCKIHKGYSWDGCSPKYKKNGIVFGTWDGKLYRHVGEVVRRVDIDQQLKYASLMHDVFCQFFDMLPDNVTREKIDKKFYFDCKKVNFKLSWLYYQSVRFYSKYIRK